MANAPHAGKPAQLVDDVVRGGASGLVDQKERGGRGVGRSRGVRDQRSSGGSRAGAGGAVRLADLVDELEHFLVAAEALVVLEAQRGGWT